MNAKFRGSMFLAVLLTMTLTFIGCHGKSSDSSTPAKTQVTTGVITGFGSVIVNGIEFIKKADVPDTQVATFKFDDTAHPQADLKIGMIVTIKGAADAATKKGEFESIEFKPELRGPADDVLISGTTGTLKVMGHDVVTGATTSFEGVADMLALQAKLTGANAGKHPEMEISGRVDNAGVFHATRIAVKADDFAAGGKAELHGKIASTPTPSAGGFTIGNINVEVTGSTILSNLTATSLTAGAAVEVKGTLNGGTLTATRIEGNHGVGEGVEVEDNVSLQGIAADAISGGSFVLNGPNGTVTVKVNDATVYMGGAAQASIVAANATLEVEGTLQADGSVLASKVKSETEIESETHSGGGGGTESGK